MIAKAAGVVIGVGLISTGGIAITKPHWLGMDYMPSFHALSKDSDYSSKKATDYGADKFGNKNTNYLVGVKGNESWWEWSFRKLKAENPPTKGKFKHEGKEGDAVKTAHGKDNDSTALNQVCKAAYSSQNSNVDDKGENNKFNKSEIWKYCSPLGKEPTKVKDNNAEKEKYPNKIGSEDSSGFISVDDSSNDMFWLIRDKEVKGSDKDNFEQVLSTDSSNHFKNGKESLKELCRRAYLTDKPENSGTSNPTKEEAEKYCKFEISNS